MVPVILRANNNYYRNLRGSYDVAENRTSCCSLRSVTIIAVAFWRVDGEHLGRFAKMQVPAIVIEQKGGNITDCRACKSGSWQKFTHIHGEHTDYITKRKNECVYYLFLGCSTGAHIQKLHPGDTQDSHRARLTADLWRLEMRSRRSTVLQWIAGLSPSSCVLHNNGRWWNNNLHRSKHCEVVAVVIALLQYR